MGGGPRPSSLRTITSSTVSARASSSGVRASGTEALGCGLGCTYRTGTGAAVNTTGLRSSGRGPEDTAGWPPERYTPETYAALKRTISSVPYFRYPEPGTLGRW